MRSLLGRFHRPMSRGAMGDMLTMNSLGDGSTLSLDFTTMGGVLDPRLTFSRASTATFVNSSGYVEYAGANLFIRSSQLTVSWAVTGVATPTTSSNAPNGDPAWRLEETNVAGVHQLSQSVTSLSQGVPYTLSLLVKKDQRSWIVLQITGSTYVYFNSDTGTFGTTSGTLIGYDKQDIGGGWWRIWVSANMTSSTAASVVYLASANGTVSYTGTTGFGVLISSPQLNPGSTAQTYYPTTTAAYHAPRFDYSPTTIGEPRGLLIEGQATNLIRYSETLETTGGLWGYNAVTRTVESSDVNPTNGTGSISFGPTTNGGSRYCGMFLTGQTTTTAYTFSAWIKAKGTSFAVVSIQNSAGAVNSTVSILSQPSGANASIAGNGGGFPRLSSLSSSGWTKIQVVTSSTLGGTGTLNVFVYPNDTSSQTTADTMFMWGCQVETGSGASSYIPTGASGVTRNADMCYADNISSWYTQGIGTMLFVGRPIQSVTRNYLNFSTGAAQPRLLMYGANNATEVILYLQNGTGSNLIFTSGSLTLGSVNRMASSFEQAKYSCVVNGGTVGTSTTASPAMPSAITRLNIGMRDDQVNQFGGHVMQVKYYPIVLPDAQIKTLTTP